MNPIPTPRLPAPIDRSSLRWDMEEDGLTSLPILYHHPIQWRDSDEAEMLELWLPDAKRWRKLRKANWLPFLEAFAEGAPLPEVRRRAAAALPHRNAPQVRFLLDRVLGSLRRWGHLELVLPDMPALLDGRYRIERELGRGGMGIVWLARDEAHRGARVAIKHAWNAVGGFRSRERVLREEHRMMGLFDHPGIVKPLATFEHEGRFHLVRDFLDAAPVPRMDRERRADPATRMSITRQVALIADHMLQRGYFYLDMKTSNFYVNAAGHVTLGDLGMCRAIKGTERVATGNTGTFAYAAPEMYRVREVRETGMVYAIGCIHWEMVVGSAPKPKVHPDRLLGRLPADLPLKERAFLEAALQERPEDRPATFQDAAAMLA